MQSKKQNKTNISINLIIVSAVTYTHKHLTDSVSQQPRRPTNMAAEDSTSQHSLVLFPDPSPRTTGTCFVRSLSVAKR